MGKRAFKNNYAAVCLPEQEAFLQVIKMPEISKEDIRSAIIYEAENYIPYSIEEVYMDSQIVPSLDHQKGLRVLISAIPRSIVDSYLSCFKKAGLKLLVMEPESLSIARVLVKNHFYPSSALFLDLGKTHTGLIFFSGKSVRFNFSVPVSGEGLTEIISKTLNVSFSKAEKMKIKYGLEAIIPSINHKRKKRKRARKKEEYQKAHSRYKANQSAFRKKKEF